ncbi:DNA mismatch repair protein MutL [Lacrimispora amygdalina]|uniref:DNA mismatch repair protein MutL n=1 Tax=Lacrimispora amygdalina TaxID=253257 RepID=A0A3E2NHH0_9FIRM|nr:DNA mismatch repair endonuclease MutL [Clostridium indicum]RFZ80447.1 DNA mismatch repair endonuclease MutL [Clostridium indicum]
MANITVLDQNTINKIAAGEVVERPASVVKELLENAIDAKATAVTVEIKEGGTSFIRVTDNGCGIPKEEVPLAFLRHSTSKIKSVEDLFTVSSLGFRGEALASIASVSQVEIITKTSVGLTGTRYQIDGGIERSIEEIGAPEGTTFIARNLFFNTPARKKFLKTPVTEGAHVADLVEKLALSHPEVSIRFIQNNQNKLHTSGNHNLKDIIYTVFGREIASNLLEVSVKKGEVTVNGFIGKPVIARGNRNYENYFINGRFIKSSIISRAIEEAYRPFMMQHKYPFTMLHFTIEPELLDVNVHPTKMELRFRDGEMIYHMVYQAVANALAHKELIPEVSLNKKDEEKKEEMPGKKFQPSPEPFENHRLMALNQTAVSQEKKPSDGFSFPKRLIPPQPESVREPDSLEENWLAPPAPVLEERTIVKQQEPVIQSEILNQFKQEQKAEQLDLFDGKLLEPESRLKHKLIGQVFDTYWLVEFSDQLYIIDQHAAHEKVLYEKTMATLKTREYTSQVINPPIILTLNRNEELLLNRHMSVFTDMGFEIEPFGGKEFAVRGVPANLFSIAKKELLIEMIDSLSDDTSFTNPSIIYEKVASMSCKAAVKGGNSLSAAEANELIDQLLKLENPYACPHGRPTIISMSRYELEKKFKRIV